MSYDQYRPQGFQVLPPVIKNLLIINVLLFAATWVIKNQTGVDLDDYLALHYFKSADFRPYQFITYMFMHGGIEHIFFNMFALWMFGNVLENFWGSKRFLIFYMITGIGAALIYMGYEAFEYHQAQAAIYEVAAHPSPESYLSVIRDRFGSFYENAELQEQVQVFARDWSHHLGDPAYSSHGLQDLNELMTAQMNIPMLGASGAIFGVLVAFGMLFPNTELYLMFIPIPIKAKYAVILYAGIEVFFGVASFSGDNVAHFAHIGGAIVGFILVKIWQRNRNTFY